MIKIRRLRRSKVTISISADQVFAMPEARPDEIEGE